MNPDRAAEILVSLIVAVRDGHTLAWAVAHAPDGRDRVAEAWAACQAPAVLLALMCFRDDMLRRVLHGLFDAGHAQHDCGAYHHDAGITHPCGACADAIRAQQPTMTLALALGR